MIRPSVGRDGGVCSFDLPDEGRVLFSRERLDRIYVICPTGALARCLGMRCRRNGTLAKNSVCGLPNALIAIASIFPIVRTEGIVGSGSPAGSMKSRK